MQPILLRGINRSGLEYTTPTASGFLQPAGLTEADMQQMITNWRANVIRLPFNQDWALHGTGDHAAEDYLSGIDQVVAWASALRAYTILDLQWLDAVTMYGHVAGANGTPVDNHVAPTPNADTILLWRTLAQRYSDEPAVIFDLFNEPHNPVSDDTHPFYVLSANGGVVPAQGRTVTTGDWVAWATRLTAEIRAIRPQGLVLVAGLDWAFDLQGISVNAPNVVYSAHIYPDRQQSDWWKAVGRRDQIPVFIGEWGGTDTDLGFGRNLAALLTDNGLGWAAWSWTDYPHLIEPPGAPDYRPTIFGQFVQQQLATANQSPLSETRG
jgi:hypothetical protein